MRINRNIAANYASRLWAGLSTFVFVPIYLHILGPEAFGLIAFSTSVLGVAFILDMGLSNAFAREMARETDRGALADLLRSLEALYVGIILVTVAVAAVAASPITEHWLNIAQLDPERVRWSVGLMLVAAVLQVMMSLYIGGLLGSSRHVAAASYQISFGLVRSGVVLIPLYFWPVVELVFAWQFAAAVICLLLLRRTVWRAIRPPSAPRFSLPALRRIRAFAGGMFGIVLISAINTQADKFVVSKLFSLDEFGLYAVAGLVGQVPSMLALPLAVTVLPRLTGHVSRKEGAELLAIYMRYSFMISAVAFVATLGVIVGAPQILAALQGHIPSSELVAVSRILAVGGALLAAQFMPYHLAIASGHTRTNLMFGALSAILMPIAMFAGAAQFGLRGVAVPWLVMNGVAAIFLALSIMPRFLGPHLFEWIWKANLLPLAVSAAVIGPAALAVQRVSDPFVYIAILALFCGLAIAINAIMLARLFRAPSPAHSLPVETR